MTSNLGWTFRNAAGDAATIEVYDLLGSDGMTLVDFNRQLQAVRGSRVELLVHSQGGDAIAGLGIYSALRQWPGQVTASVSLAASAASVLIMGCDHIEMTTGGRLFIHEPYLPAAHGDAADLLAASKLANSIANMIAACYCARAGGSLDGWRQLMRDETWFTAEEACRAGLADSIASEKKRMPMMPSMAAEMDAAVRAARQERARDIGALVTAEIVAQATDAAVRAELPRIQRLMQQRRSRARTRPLTSAQRCAQYNPNAPAAALDRLVWRG